MDKQWCDDWCRFWALSVRYEAKFNFQRHCLLILLPRSAASLSATLQAMNVQNLGLPLLESRAHLARHRNTIYIALPLSPNRPLHGHLASQEWGLEELDEPQRCRASSWANNEHRQLMKLMDTAGMSIERNFIEFSKGPCCYVFSRQQTQAERDEAVRTISAFVLITFYPPNSNLYSTVIVDTWQNTTHFYQSTSIHFSHCFSAFSLEPLTTCPVARQRLKAHSISASRQKIWKARAWRAGAVT